MTFRTIDQVKELNRAKGFRWFDPDMLRFFDSRIGRDVVRRAFFRDVRSSSIVTSRRGCTRSGGRTMTGPSTLWASSKPSPPATRRRGG